MPPDGDGFGTLLRWSRLFASQPQPTALNPEQIIGRIPSAQTMQNQFEIIWDEGENPAYKTPLLRVHLSDTPEAEPSARRHVDYLPTVCGAPACGCSAVQLIAQPLGDGTLPELTELPSEAWLDLTLKGACQVEDPTQEAAAARLGEIIDQHLNSNDLLRLKEWFYIEKSHLIQATPLDQLDITNLPTILENRMLPFTDVFRAGHAFFFDYEGERWGMEDHHCLVPDCECTEYALEFLRFGDLSEWWESDQGLPPALRYDLVTQVSTSHTGKGPADPKALALFAAAKAANPEFAQMLQLRRAILQNLYLRQEIEVARDRILNPQIRSAPKVGRNDPCPCGSGLKYKRCCG